MKRKVVFALIATLTLTAGSMGTVFATNNYRSPDTDIVAENAEESHEGMQWVVDSPAVYEDRWVVDKEAVYEQQWVVDKEAVYEQQYVVDKESYETQQWVETDEPYDEPIYDYCEVCNQCGKIIYSEYLGINEMAYITGETTPGGTLISRDPHYEKTGHTSGSYTFKQMQVDTIHHPAGGYWQTVIVAEEGHYENILVSPEEGHWEDVLVSPEEGHWESVLVQEEIGHWEPIAGEPGTDDPTVEEPETPGTDDPTVEAPEEPGTDDPTTEEPETPDTGDNNEDQTETPSEDEAQTSDKNEQEQADNSNQKTEETNQAQNSNNTSAATEEKSDTTATASNENKAPKTGDPSSMIYLATLAGSAVTGGTAFGLRKKIKK